MIALPPLLPGAVKAMVAVFVPGVPVPIVGAAGTPVPIAKLCVTVTAALKSILPDWLAAMVHVPSVRSDTTAAATVQTPVVLEVKFRARPDEADAPVMVNGDAFSCRAASVPKVILCDRLATTRLKFWLLLC